MFNSHPVAQIVASLNTAQTQKWTNSKQLGFLQNMVPLQLSHSLLMTGG